jgi:hypothetical protein
MLSSIFDAFVKESPVFRREWSSTYAGLQDSQLPRAQVLKLLVKEIATQQQPILVGDLSQWHRPVAKVLNCGN